MSSWKDRVEAVWPSGMRAARAMREARAASQAVPVQTPWGFTHRGSAHQASGSFEAAELAFFRDRLDVCDVVVDLGANTGLYTGMAAALHKPVIAVEPSPANVQTLLANIRDNAFSRVSVHPVALGAKSEVLTLYGSGVGASLVKGWMGARQQTDVAVHTLDSILLGAGVLGRSRAFIKMDVEGAELQVLSGAHATLAADPAPEWMVEVNFDEHHPDGKNPDFAAVFDTFWTSGYSATSVDAQREVTPEDLQSWLRAGRRAFGGHNYAFAKV